jgi:hypothetical protein
MRACKIARLAAVSAVLALAGSAGAAEPDADLAYAEKTLQEARVGIAGPDLVKFFERRTLSESDRKKLVTTVRHLGDDDFHVRQKAYKDLLVAGRVALPFLRPARQDGDPEIARSAERLVRRIEGGSDTVLAVAAARVLAARKPAGSTRALLAFLPQADDESVQEAVLDALAAAGVRDGKVNPRLAAALRAADPLQRLAAARAHGRGGPELRPALKPLLNDADARVRFEAAAALVRGGDKSAVEPLMGLLLTEKPANLAWQVEDMLYHLAGKQAPQATLGSSAGERRQCLAAWSAWWRANQAGVDLAKLNLKKTLLGFNLVCECGAGKNPQGYVWEFGGDGKVRWEFNNVNTPSDVQPLSGGRVLVAIYHGNEVTERDRTGKILWTHRTANPARSCQRLANGNTFIATNAELLEVTRDGKVVYSIKRPENIFRGRKLRNGHILYVSGRGRVVEMDTTGKEVRTVNVPGGTGVFADVDLLPNGRFLVALYSGNKVFEMDAAGKVLWEFGVQTPSSVNRLPNGNTLVTSMDARLVVEYNRDGKPVWKQQTPGRPFCVRRY